MKERIKRCNVLYDSWQMQCCGDPIEVGKVANLTIVPGCDNPKNLAGIDIDFYEDHHDRAGAKLRGLVVGIKTLFIEKYADEKRYTDNPLNTFAVYEASYVDGYEDHADYENHNNSDVDYYIITMVDVVEGVLQTIRDCCSNREICIEPNSNYIIRNSQGQEVGDATGLTVYRDEKQKRIEFPLELQQRLKQWHEDYYAHINEGLTGWRLNDWANWYIQGWIASKLIRALLPDDCILYYGNSGMSEGVVRVRDGWALNDGGLSVQITINLENKITEGTFIPQTYLDWTYDNDDDYRYKFSAARADHHFYPSDKVVLKVCTWPLSEGYRLATVIDCEDDGIIVQAYGCVDISEEYSIELIG